MNALTILAVGKTLYKKVNQEEYILQSQHNNKGFLSKIAERNITHPSLPKRISEIKYYYDNNFNIFEKRTKRAILSSAVTVIAMIALAVVGVKYGGDILFAEDGFLSDAFVAEDIAIITAVAEGDVNKVKELLNEGTNPNIQDMDGWTPLMWAAWEGNVEMINVLIEAGAIENMTDYYEETALIKAIYSNNVEAINALISAGAEIEMIDSSGWTPLMYAVSNGSIEPVKALIAAGADVDHTDSNNFTAFLYAKKYGYDDIADLLKQQ